MSKKIQNAELPLLITKKDQLRGDIDLLKADIAELQERIALLGEYWSGSAAQAYLSRAAAGISGLNEFASVSEKLYEDYSFAVSVYRLDEQKAKEIFLSV